MSLSFHLPVINNLPSWRNETDRNVFPTISYLIGSWRFRVNQFWHRFRHFSSTSFFLWVVFKKTTMRVRDFLAAYGSLRLSGSPQVSSPTCRDCWERKRLKHSCTANLNCRMEIFIYVVLLGERTVAFQKPHYFFDSYINANFCFKLKYFQ